MSEDVRSLREELRQLLASTNVVGEGDGGAVRWAVRVLETGFVAPMEKPRDGDAAMLHRVRELMPGLDGVGLLAVAAHVRMAWDWGNSNGHDMPWSGASALAAKLAPGAADAIRVVEPTLLEQAAQLWLRAMFTSDVGGVLGELSAADAAIVLRCMLRPVGTNNNRVIEVVGPAALDAAVAASVAVRHSPDKDFRTLFEAAAKFIDVDAAASRHSHRRLVCIATWKLRARQNHVSDSTVRRFWEPDPTPVPIPDNPLELLTHFLVHDGPLANLEGEITYLTAWHQCRVSLTGGELMVHDLQDSKRTYSLALTHYRCGRFHRPVYPRSTIRGDLSRAAAENIRNQAACKLWHGLELVPLVDHESAGNSQKLLRVSFMVHSSHDQRDALERVVEVLGRSMRSSVVGVRLRVLEAHMAAVDPHRTMTTEEACAALLRGFSESAPWIHTTLAGPRDVAPATVFVSHRWAMRFAELVETLRAYPDAEHQAFWVDVWCKNQRAVTAAQTLTELSTGVNAARVMNKEKFGEAPKPSVVLVVDALPVVPALKRIWCLFEMFTASQQLNAPVDYLLTRGALSAFEEALASTGEGGSSTPPALLWARGTSLNVSAEEANATDPQDVKNILAKVKASSGGVRRFNAILTAELMRGIRVAVDQAASQRAHSHD